MFVLQSDFDVCPLKRFWIDFVGVVSGSFTASPYTLFCACVCVGLWKLICDVDLGRDCFNGSGSRL